jgi:hypothetical protein
MVSKPYGDSISYFKISWTDIFSNKLFSGLMASSFITIYRALLVILLIYQFLDLTEHAREHF